MTFILICIVIIIVCNAFSRFTKEVEKSVDNKLKNLQLNILIKNTTPEIGNGDPEANAAIEEAEDIINEKK